jgi:hypothetical protein
MVAEAKSGGDTRPYDISRIDFNRLRKEFERSPAQRTTVQNLKQTIERNLQRLLAQNRLRTDFHQHYEEIVDKYNREKDRVTIGQTFDARTLLERGVPVADVADLLGDDEETVREHYSRWVPERQARLTNILQNAFNDKPKPKLVAIPRKRR